MMERLMDDAIGIQRLLPWIGNKEDIIYFLRKIPIDQNHLRIPLCISYFSNIWDHSEENSEQNIENDAREIVILLPDTPYNLIKDRLRILGNIPNRKEVVVRQLLNERVELKEILQEMDIQDCNNIRKRHSEETLLDENQDNKETNIKIKIRKVDGSLEVVSSIKQGLSGLKKATGVPELYRQKSSEGEGSPVSNANLPGFLVKKSAQSTSGDISITTSYSESNTHPATTTNVTMAKVQVPQTFNLIDYLKEVTHCPERKIKSMCRRLGVSTSERPSDMTLNDLLNMLFDDNVIEVADSDTDNSSDYNDSSEVILDLSHSMELDDCYAKEDPKVNINSKPVLKPATLVIDKKPTYKKLSNKLSSSKRVRDSNIIRPARLRPVEIIPAIPQGFLDRIYSRNDPDEGPRASPDTSTNCSDNIVKKDSDNGDNSLPGDDFTKAIEAIARIGNDFSSETESPGTDNAEKYDLNTSTPNIESECDDAAVPTTSSEKEHDYSQAMVVTNPLQDDNSTSNMESGSNCAPEISSSKNDVPVVGHIWVKKGFNNFIAVESRERRQLGEYFTAKENTALNHELGWMDNLVEPSKPRNSTRIKEETIVRADSIKSEIKEEILDSPEARSLSPWAALEEVLLGQDEMNMDNEETTFAYGCRPKITDSVPAAAATGSNNKIAAGCAPSTSGCVPSTSGCVPSTSGGIKKKKTLEAASAQISSNPVKIKSEETNQLPYDETLVLRIMEIFPEACPDYIKNVCRGKSFAHVDEIVTVVLSQESYPKRPTRVPSPPKEYDMEEQLEIVKALLPDADPTYLRWQCEKFGKNTEQLNEFINEARETKTYPTMKEYLRKQKLSAQSKQYTTEFNVKNFVELFPDPEKTFRDPSRSFTVDNYTRLYICNFFQNRYDKLAVRYVRAALQEHDHKILLSDDAMERLLVQKVVMKSRRKNIILQDAPTNIAVLQELAYLTHKEEIEKYINDIKEKEEQEKRIAKENNLLITCQCCYDDEVMPKDIVCCPNACSFCRSCVLKSCEVAMGDGKTDFKCLNDCPEEFTLQTLQKVLPPKMFSKLAQKKALAEVKAAGIEELESCPFCDFASIPNPNDKIFRCLNPDCMKESCRLCKEENHVPYKCDEVEKDADVKARVFVENQMTEALLRKCWKCSKSFFKEEGCNKMTCTCGAKMCYICKQPVKDYTHFNGLGGDKYELCPLYSDTNEFNQKNVIKAAEDAKAKVDPAKLKIDPSLDVAQHYQKRKRQLPQEPHIRLLQDMGQAAQRHGANARFNHIGFIAQLANDLVDMRDVVPQHRQVVAHQRNNPPAAHQRPPQRPNR